MPLTCPIPCITCTPGAPGSRGLSPLDDNPFLNLSSEAADENVFIGRKYTPFTPPLGKFFYAVGCVGYCFSSKSQEDADLCAQRQNALCNSSNWPGAPIPPSTPGNPVTRPASQLFPNQKQTATFTCANGSTSTYEVGAGSFFASSTAQANAFALSYARNHAAQKAICLSELSRDRICFYVSSSVTLFATNYVGQLIYAVVGGFLPDGMELEQDGTTATITGTPVAGGSFTFTIGVTDSVNGYAESTYTLQVFGINVATALSPATIRNPYSFDLTISGAHVGVLDFALTSGSLPAGLTLNASTGFITGTPTAAAVGSFNFSITVSDYVNGSPVISCKRDLTMQVLDPAGVFWNIVWGTPVITVVGGGAGSIVGVNNICNGNTSVPAFVSLPANQTLYSITGSLAITPTTNIHGIITSIQTSSVDNAQARALIQLDLNGGSAIYQRSSFSGDVPIGTGAFTLLAGFPYTVNILMSFFTVSQPGGAPNPDAKTCLASLTVEQVP